MKKYALKNRIKGFFRKYKTTVFVVTLCLQLAIGLAIYFLFGRISPNDEIFVPKEGSVAFLINENPNFSVDFGKVEEPDKQWVRFEAQTSNKNPFEEERRNIFTKIAELFQKKERYGIEMSLVGVDLNGENLKKYGDEVIQVADVIGTDSVKTSTELVDSGREIGAYEDQETPVSKQTVLNKEVTDGVDLEYQILKGLGLKEEIIIRDLEAYKSNCKEKECLLPVNEFVFDLKMDSDVQLREGWFTVDGQSTSTYYFVDSKGRYIAHFLPNFAIDNVNNKTFNVKLNVEKGEDNNYRAKVTVNLEWLLSSERVFPVRIDPSIVHDDTADFSGGIFNRVEIVTGPKIQLLEGLYCSGGVESTYGRYKIHTFLSSDTLVCSGSGEAEVLVVAGGGGGANTGSGGGAGGYVYNTDYSIAKGSYAVTVGAGGAGGISTDRVGKKGGNSVFSTITAEGGGYGVSHGGSVGGSGGSGGGGPITTSGTATSGGAGSQGYAGGAGYVDAGWVGNSGGGGGAGAAGASGGNMSGSGNGGIGLVNSISGKSVYYAGGGGSGEVNGSYVGTGGNGGGGSGVLNAAGTNGEANTGGGGGGGSYNAGTYTNGGKGGSGIVIVRYLIESNSGEYTSSSMDMGSSLSEATLSWTPSGVNTGNGETPYSTTNMVAQWNFNETSGTTAISGGTCGTSCNGTLTNFASTGSQDAAAGTGWTSNNKRWGAGALMFDGTDDCVDVGDIASLDITTDISLDGWIKTTQTSAGYIISRRDGTTYQYGLLVNSSGYVQITGSGATFLTSTEVVNDGNWHYIAGTISGTNGQIYIDGALSVEGTVDALTSQAVDVVLGGRGDGAGGYTSYFNGIIDSPRIFSRVLSASEILSNYQAGNIEFQYRVSTDNSTWSDWTSYNDGSLIFDGTDDYVDIGATPTTGTGSFTLEAWIKTTISGTTKRIISYGDTTTNTGLTLFVNTSNKVQFSLANTTGPESAATVTDGNWHHLAAVNSSGTVQLYVDGSASGSSMAMTPNISSTSTNIIGADIGATTDFFYGVIDSVKAYSRALGASEIASNYAMPDGESPSSSVNLTAHWKFNETSGTTVANSGIGGPSFVGTLTNFSNTTSRDALTNSGWSSTTKRASNIIENNLDDSDEQWTTELNLYQTASPLVNVSGSVNVGSGKDGACTVSSGTVTISAASCSGRATADAVAFSSTVATTQGSTSITLSSTPTGLTSGDEVLIINMQGTSTVTVGLYETHIISSISTNTLNFLDYPLKYTYDGTTQKIAVQRVPNYTNVTVSSGAVLTADVWDGSKYGVLFFRASGTVSNSGTISMDAKGYAGGPRTTGASAGMGGESFCANPGGGSQGAANGVCGGGAGGGIGSRPPGTGSATGGAGGGGGLGGGDPYALGGGGGAGGYGSPGTAGAGWNGGYAGGRDVSGNGGTWSGSQGRGAGGGSGGTYGSSTLSKLYLGSGGGSGGATWGSNYGGIGGKGGGIIYIAADTLTNGGVGIVSRGGGGGQGVGSGKYITGSGAGGAGGSVKIEAVSASLGTNLILVSGGAGGTNGADGGTGGVGRIAVFYTSSLSGSVASPLAYTQRYLSSAKSEGNGAVQISNGSNSYDPYTVALWHMDERSGTSAYVKDSSGNLNDGTPTGTTYVSGKVSGGRSFNGSSDYINVGTYSNMSPTSQVSVSAWIKSDSTISAIESIYDRLNGAQGYGLYINASGQAVFGINGSTVTAVSSMRVDDQLWHHIAGTYNSGEGGTQEIKIYVDGVLAGTGDYSVAISYSTEPRNQIGRMGTGSYFGGYIDELTVSIITRTANEIAESYRLGKDTYISQSLNNIDFSTKESIGIDVASDRPGEYLSATWGESAFANYQPDVNTVGLWHMDEISGSGAYIKDSSIRNNGGTPTGTTYTTDGKLGGARIFNGTSDYLSFPNLVGIGTGNVNNSIELWMRPTAVPTIRQWPVLLGAASNGNLHWTYNTDGKIYMGVWNGGQCSVFPTVGAWNHVVSTYDGTTIKCYLNGSLISSASATLNLSSTAFKIAQVQISEAYFNGSIDEIRISNIARTADEIRQAYEVNLRTHPVQIDFGASLVSGNLITGSGDTSFSIDATVYGLDDLGSELYVGEKVIVKENYDGTEYLAQGTVSAITASTGAVTVSSWDSGSTFPSAGYTVNADVFKWQKEYIPIKNRTVGTHVDAVNLLTFRITNGDQGRNIWIDDLRSSSGYLSAYTGEELTFPSSGRYFQYKAIFSTWDIAVTPYISQVQLDYFSGPTLDLLMRHGKWFNSSGVKQPFWWVGTH